MSENEPSITSDATKELKCLSAIEIEGETIYCDMSLQEATKFNHHVCVKNILGKICGETCDQYEQSKQKECFFSSIEQDNYETVKVFLEMGFSPTAPGKFYSKIRITPLHIASEILSSKMIELLLENGADINATNEAKESPLHYIIKYGHYKNNPKFEIDPEKEMKGVECLKILLSKKDLEVNALDARGRTALHLAAMQRNESYVTELIEG